ncbi:hypothetical protein JTB14_028665 [Gonioctena quinquepunctata]|nr:hypothetical protein JTB14_028665 [Gonioctena quinquepunctata]
METSIEHFPPVTAFDMSSYLANSSFYTNPQMKAYKSLTGYKYFDAGFVYACEAKSIRENIVVLCKVDIFKLDLFIIFLNMYLLYISILGQASTEDEQSPTASLDYMRERWCNNFSSLYLHGRPF